jgi:hypothetical protein
VAILRLNIGDLTMRKLNLIYMEDLIRGYLVTGKLSGCTNSQKKLHCWGQEICEDHDIKHADCPCLVPYKLHCLPKDDQKRRSWLKEINESSILEFHKMSNPNIRREIQNSFI